MTNIGLISENDNSILIAEYKGIDILILFKVR